MPKLLPGLIFALIAVVPARAAVPATVTGLWYSGSGDAGIRVEACGDQLCGRIVWLRPQPVSPDKTGYDLHNGDPALRTRPLCGLALFEGFHKSADGGWGDGTIYDPEDGRTYDARLELRGDDRLKVRGYVGLPLFGKSETWRRAPADLPPCAP